MLFRQVYLTFAVMCDAMLKVSALLYYCLCIDFSIVFLVFAFGHGLTKLSNILIYRLVMTLVTGRDVAKTWTLIFFLPCSLITPEVIGRPGNWRPISTQVSSKRGTESQVSQKAI